MRRILVFLLVCIVGGFLLAGCTRFSTQVEKSGGGGAKMLVVTSFYPMYEFARQVGGEKVEVVALVPAETEPHDWEPTPRDIAVLQKAKVFVYNGAGLEHWVEKTLKNCQKPELIIVEAAQGLADIKSTGELTPNSLEKQGNTDPHVWLDPLAAQQQVQKIRDAFIKADPANRSYYEANAAGYIAKLAALDEEFRLGLAQLPRKKFISSHAAFGYLAKRYGLEQIPIAGLAPGAEPTPERLKYLVQVAGEQGIKYVFFETLVSPKVAEIVAKEAGIKTLVLNPVAGLTEDEMRQGKDYLTLMRENLTNLKLALEGE